MSKQALGMDQEKNQIKASLKNCAQLGGMSLFLASLFLRFRPP